jgi:hypothetical protein
MRSFFQQKLWVALFAVLALGALTVLAVSLEAVSFNAAQRFARSDAESLAPTPAQGTNPVLVDVPLWKQLTVLALVTLLVFMVSLLLSPELRKRMLIIFVRTTLIVLATLYLFRTYGEQLFGWQQAAGNSGQAGDLANAQPMPEFQPPEISSALSYVVSLAFALVSILVIWALYKGWQRYNFLNSKKPLDEIAHIARTSLNDLTAGRDSSDVIIKCYLRMSDVVADKRRLQREPAVTPQEFALRLERAGLPGDAVRRLTRLFEAVRYGDRKSAPKDVTEAVSCLNTILRYCGAEI